ncbi:MAG: PilZ domain-containing protein [Solirubrobacteraceae bacterium]
MSPRASSEKVALPALSGSFGRLLRGPGKDIAVEVIWQSANELTLSVLAQGAVFNFPAVEELVLECSSTRGMTRLAGEARQGGEGRLSFVVHEVIEVEQRRRFVRVRVSRPVRLARAADGSVSHTFALDLSGGGLLLAGPDKLKPGEHVNFHMRLESGGEPIEGYARVVRVAGSGSPALTFDSIKPADRERLIHFIFDCERRARALLHAAPDASGDAHEPGAGK